MFPLDEEAAKEFFVIGQAELKSGRNLGELNALNELFGLKYGQFDVSEVYYDHLLVPYL
jgi:hypothetical protein